MTFGEQLKRLRQQKHISQNALADLAGVSPRTIYGYEAGTTYPRTEKIREQLARALGVDIQELTGDDEATTSPTSKEPVLSATERAQIATAQMVGLLSSGALTDDEKDDMLQAVQNAYWDSKKKTSKRIF